MSEEYYIRTDDQEEPKAFTVDQLQTLAEAGKIDRETLCYDEEAEVWIMIGEFTKISDKVFPERKKLSLKQVEERLPPTKAPFAGESDLDSEGNELPSTDVEEMLAAAEGETEGTEHLKRREERRNAAASISLPGIGIMMFLSAFMMIYPEYTRIQLVLEQETYSQLLNPLIIVGGIDLLLAIFLLLAVSEVYPVVRLRAALGLGFWTYIFWSGGDYTLMGTAFLGHLCLFISTMTLSLYVMMSCLVVGIASFALFAFFSYSGVLVQFL